MRTYAYSEAREWLAELLDMAKQEDIAIRRPGGERFVISFRQRDLPFEIPGVTDTPKKRKRPKPS